MVNSAFTHYHALVQWLFTRLYREFAWLYDRVAALVSWGHWDDWVVAIADEVHGDVLELGCGTGYLQAELSGRSPTHRVVGLDISRQMLGLTQRRSQKLGIQACLLGADAQHIALASQQFDTIVATFPSDYILQAATLSEIQRLLRPNGCLLVLLSASLPGPGWYRSLVELAYGLTLQAGSSAAARQSATAAQPQAQQLSPRIQEHLHKAGLDGRAFLLETTAGQLFGIMARCHAKI